MPSILPVNLKQNASTQKAAAADAHMRRSAKVKREGERGGRAIRTTSLAA